MTAERYYVRRPTGKIFGPFDKNAIHMMLTSNKLGWDAELSPDKVGWTELANIPEFADAVNPDLPRAVKATGPSDLPKPVALPPDLPRAKMAPLDLPRPVRSDADLPRPVLGGSNLPKPSGLDLPRPSSLNLPKPAGMPSLPRAVEAGLPRAVEAGLPRAVEAGLPRAVEAGLPRTVEAGLPRTVEAGLPRTVEAGLPRTVEAGLPRTVEAGLLAPKRPRDLPSRAAGLPTVSQDEPTASFDISKSLEVALQEPHAQMPPVYVEEDVFSTPPAFRAAEDDDLFGGPMSTMGADDDDLFGASSESVGRLDEQALFGAPSARGSQDDDLFDAPSARGDQDDDLFGSPFEGNQVSSPRQPMREEDLFGEPLGDVSEADLFGVPGDEGAQDLFGGDEDSEGDFLDGDQGFSFLDARPQALDAKPQAGLDGGDSWGADLLGGGDQLGGASQSENWEDELLMGNAPASLGPSRVHVDLDEMEPAVAAHTAPPVDVDERFRPASSGVPEQPGVSVHQTQGQAADADKNRGLMMQVGVAVAAASIFCVVGYVIYSMVDSNRTTVVTNNTTKKIEFHIDLKKLRVASYAELLDLWTRSKKANFTKALHAHVMLVEALYLSRYQNEELEKSGLARAQTLQGVQQGIAAVAVAGFKGVTSTTGGASKAREVLKPFAAQDGEEGFYAKVFIGITGVLELERISAMASKKAVAGIVTKPNKGKTQANTGDPALLQPKVSKALAAEAKKMLESAAKTEGTMPHYWLGRLYKALGQEKKAVASYKASLKVSDDYIPSHAALGQLYYEQGDLNQASKNLERLNKELNAKASSSERTMALHFMGEVHSARSQSDLAIAHYTKALQIDAGRTKTLRALAEEYERAKKYKEALNFFKTNKSLGQKDPDVMLGIVRAYMGLKEWKQAGAHLELGEKNFPSDARFPFYLGQLNMKRGTYPDAQKALQRAVDINPKLLMAHAALAQLAWRNDKDTSLGERHIKTVVEYPKLIDARVAKEVAEFYKMAQNRALAAKWYRSSISKDPNFWAARLSLSRLFLEEGKTEQALKILERSRNEGVTDIRLSAYLADAYRQSKMYDRAINEINKVIEKFPKNPEYMFIRGRIYFDRGNFNTALQDFNKAYELNPRYHEAYFYVGRTEFAKDNSSTALKIFRHVLDYQPNNGEFRFYMGRVLEDEGRFTQALEEYRKITDVDPGYGVRNPRVYIRRGRLLSRLGYSNEGKKDIIRALELAPEMDDALIAMGEADFRDKVYTQSIKHFSKVLTRSPKHPNAQFKLGMSYVYGRQNRKGAQHLQLAIQYGYKNPDVYRTLGYLYKDLGQRNLARKAFETCYEKIKDKKDLPRNTLREVLRQISELGG